MTSDFARSVAAAAVVMFLLAASTALAAPDFSGVNYMLEDNCSEGIWMKALEAEATGKPATPDNEGGN